MFNWIPPRSKLADTALNWLTLAKKKKEKRKAWKKMGAGIESEFRKDESERIERDNV